MNSKKFPLIVASAAMALAACSDTVDSNNAVNDAAENYTQVSVTTYTCTDGSVVDDASLCPTVVDPTTGEEVSGVADSVVTTTITCADGSVVEDAALCPQIEPASSSSQKTSKRSSSSAAVNPGSSASQNPASSGSSSTPVVIPSDDDDDTDLEDAKTLTGSEIMLKLAGTTATVENNNGCVTVEGSVATITCPADYYITGTSTDFQVVVNTPGIENEGNTGLYLYNATLKSSGAPILVKNADKTVLHLVKGTVNSVEDGSNASAHLFEKVNGTQDTAKAAIYAKDDLKIKGSGKLTVTANYNNGIQSSNDLRIKNGDITVTAAQNGLKGKGSLVISGGTLNITAKSGDGLESDECTEDANGNCTGVVDGKGIVVISGGNITVNAGDDGIQAYNYVMVSDSTEAATVSVKSTGKGIVSDNLVYMNGGTVTVDATDDGLHSGLNIWMNAGNVTISTKDDGIHADSTLYLNGSTVNVKTAYEGMEAFYIRAQAGITSTYGTDDGWNAAGGTDNNSSNTGNQGWAMGGGGMMSSSKGYIVVSGGYHYISASGNDIDVLDANGTATQTGGVLILEIPTSTSGGMQMAPGGNWGGSSSGSGCSTNMAGGLIDTDNGFTITGGVLIGFGSRTEEYPSCSATSYTSSNYYGASNAAAKPQGSGSMVIYGGDVKSVAQVETSGMTEIKFPNGVSYMYK
ncbi:carbohydrate-binding domain-containing protein [Fibrobacter sp. UWEL]|uniref:carbohydrate-binding domain-containing protein n=1 Tax=Fibrobacter sp. UWEL TaxID=1896209 RepID=UPI0009153F12|nr:carbohydrate-binding domain-containing protein [Fibrobacter sp. UWEL]SHL25231.1 protein of unknown function [Fibrobacter sp. UWEL]